MRSATARSSCAKLPATAEIPAVAARSASVRTLNPSAQVCLLALAQPQI